MLRRVKRSLRFLRLIFFIGIVLFGGSGLLHYMQDDISFKHFNIRLHQKNYLHFSDYWSRIQTLSNTHLYEQRKQFPELTNTTNEIVANKSDKSNADSFASNIFRSKTIHNEKNMTEREVGRHWKENLSGNPSKSISHNNLNSVKNTSELMQVHSSSTTKLHTLQMDHAFSSDKENSLDKNLSSNETEEEFFERMKIRMKRRRNITKQACQKLGLNTSNTTYRFWSKKLPSPLPWLFVSNKYSLMYCEVPKTGCSNWKKVLMVLNGLANSTADIKPGQEHAASNSFVEYSPSDEEKKIYSQMTKLVIVRDPMERLLSAYVDKVVKKSNAHAPLFAKFSSEIAKEYGSRWTDPTKHFPDGTKSLTTCEFRVAELFCENSREVIKVLTATFGRNDNTTCRIDPRWKGERCSSQRAYYVTTQMCNGKQKCEVVASQAQFGIMTECPSLFKYLTITYHCVALEEMNTVTVCHNDAYNITCPPGGVISIWSAFYGRKNRKTCSFRASMLNIECSSDTATAVLSSKCNRKSACTVHSTQKWLQAARLCPATTKYLQVWFTCTASSIRNTTQQETQKKHVAGVDGKERKTLSTSVKEKRFGSSVYKPPGYIAKKYDLEATFDEFVSYLLDPANDDFSKDVIDHGSSTMKQTSVRHWELMHKLSYPCHIDYDVIAHMETIEEDARYVLKSINAPPELQYPKGYGKAGKSSTTSERTKNLLRSLEKNKLKKLLKKFKLDYEIFGYPMPIYRTDL